jgi:hypothetical protein
MCCKSGRAEGGECWRMEVCPCASTHLPFASDLLGCGGGRTERNAEAIEGIHQPDRIGEVGKFLVAEFSGSRFIVSIGNAGFGHARYGFGPSKCDTFAMAEYIPCVTLYRHPHELLHRKP